MIEISVPNIWPLTSLIALIMICHSAVAAVREDEANKLLTTHNASWKQIVIQIHVHTYCADRHVQSSIWRS